MKSILWLLAVAPLLLVTANAAPQASRSHDSYSGPGMVITDPTTLARIAARSEKLHEAFDLKTEAKEAIRKNDSALAFTLLQQAVSLNPRDSEICMLLTYFYIQKGQPANVIATLNPIVYPPSGESDSVGNGITTRMIYVLALLDRNSWREAVTSYQKSWHPPHTDATSPAWHLFGDGPSHAWPDLKFSPDVPDYAGLRAQAHLILGSSIPTFIEEKDRIPYMLRHLSQVLQMNPNSLDARFLSGCLLGREERFDEARAAYASAAQLGSPAVQKEINAELRKLKTNEDGIKRYQAQQAALHAKPK